MRQLMLTVAAVLVLVSQTIGPAAALASTPVTDPPTADTQSAFAHGLNASAVYFSDRGLPIATITVTNVQRGWEDYADYYEPEPGLEYVAVSFEIEVIARGNLVLEPYDLSLLDGFGRNNSRSYVSPAEGVSLLEESAAIASGETTEFTIVFELYQEAQVGYLLWQPDSGVIVLVDLTALNTEAA